MLAGEWALAELMVWSRVLSEDEFDAATAFFVGLYGLLPPSPPSPPAAPLPPLPPSPPLPPFPPPSPPPLPPTQYAFQGTAGIRYVGFGWTPVSGYTKLSCTSRCGYAAPDMCFVPGAVQLPCPTCQFCNPAGTCACGTACASGASEMHANCPGESDGNCTTNCAMNSFSGPCCSVHSCAAPCTICPSTCAFCLDNSMDYCTHCTLPFICMPA